MIFNSCSRLHISARFLSKKSRKTLHLKSPFCSLLPFIVSTYTPLFLCRRSQLNVASSYSFKWGRGTPNMCSHGRVCLCLQYNTDSILPVRYNSNYSACTFFFSPYMTLRLNNLSKNSYPLSAWSRIQALLSDSKAQALNIYQFVLLIFTMCNYYK